VSSLRSVVATVVLLLAVLIVPLVLHFTQRRHNVLPFDVTAAFPPTSEMVGGEAFASTLVALVEHELESTTGWRPNDFLLWGPQLWADNNANRQLGIIQAVRESTRIMRDNLTKVSATEYDQNLLDADTKLRNDEYKFWFPSAESRFEEGVKSLRKYLKGLAQDPPTSKPITRRNVELIRLFQAWTDLLGDAHASLLREDAPFLKTDDDFYRAQGYAHVMYHLTRAIRREYEGALAGREEVLHMMDRIAASLGEAATIKPLMVLNGSPAGLLANHRRNLDAFIVDARQTMYSTREELEK
jgi:hypothetical protein